jgi:hypothetical protein
MRGVRNARRRYETPPDDPHIRFGLYLSDFDVFTRSILEARGAPDKPFNSRCHRSAGQAVAARERKLVRFRSRCGWWSQTGSNRRPHACKARALPTELWPLNFRSRPQSGAYRRSRPVRPRVTHRCGGPRRTRTADLTLIRRVL